MALWTWIGIAACLSQAALLSGLNLAIFTISKLELRIEVAKKNPYAARVEALRKDAHFLLATILWGNVSVNVLLALLSDSVLAGAAAFLFSTVVITIFGEIVPQAYFSRHALRVGSLFAPVLRVYQAVLFPVAKPTAWALDRYLGREAVFYFQERDVRELIQLHMRAAQTEIDEVEGRGALNFLALDDVPLAAEGEPIDPESIVPLRFLEGRPVFPDIRPTADDEFLARIHRSGKKWIVLIDEAGEPRFVMDSDEFLRDALFDTGRFDPARHVRRPIIEREARATIGEVLSRLKVRPAHAQDDVIDDDVVVLWGEKKRIITGADVLGRLLRGIVMNPAGTEG